jgi:hypothetical protein
MLARPAVLLRIEGGVLFAVTILGYWESHASWILFAVLLLAPDLSFAGYAAGVKMGAAVYNLVHTLTGPLILLAYGLVAAHFSLLPYGWVWALLGAHAINDLDRAYRHGSHARFWAEVPNAL